MGKTVPSTDSELLAEIRAVIAEPYNAEYQVRVIRDLLEARPGSWLDTGSGAGAVIPLPDSPYDPRD